MAEALTATFVEGESPRDSVLFVWGNGAATTRRTIAVAADGGVERLAVDGVEWDMATAIERLLEPHESPTLHTWGAATRFALGLIERGRVIPTATPAGVDAWRAGPLDPADREHLGLLAAALPAAGHAIPTTSDGPILIPAAHHTVGRFVDAVVDRFLRTSAGPKASGAAAYASATSTTVVDDAAAWLDQAGGPATAASVLLRVEPADHPDRSRAVFQVQSVRDPGLALDAADLWGAPDSVLRRFGPHAETDLLLTLRRAASVWPPIASALEGPRPEGVGLTDDLLDELFGPVAEHLASAGLPVMWPAGILADVSLRATATTPAPTAVTSAGFDLEGMAQLTWEASLDGERLSDDELRQLVEAKRPMVRLRGRWVRADPERLARVRKRQAIRVADVVAAALAGVPEPTDGEPDDELSPALTGGLDDLVDRLRDLARADDERPEPEGLEAVLRPYQRRGVGWLVELAALGLGGVLADDMGLGKTVQVLALHRARIGSGPTLIVAPATLLANWLREAERFTPTTPIRRYHAASRSLDDVAEDEIVVTTYGVLRRDRDVLAGQRWGLVVADEAQAIKNPYGRAARALRGIPARTRFALTGTPVENRLSDLWALIDWTVPGLLGDLETFRRRVAVPVERDRDEEATRRLASTVAPFLLRRRKSDPEIVPDLPPKTETDRFVGLTVEQASLYRAAVDETMAAIEESAGIQRRGLVLKLMTALKQICNHPAQFLHQAGPIEGRSAKLAALLDLVDVIASEGESVLVFTQYVAMGRLLERALAEHRPEFLHGGLGLTARQDMVDRFQAGEFGVFLISLKAGGTGLNLTKATHVVHYDRWWNPAVEDQASDRAWRIGQDRPVQVHRMVTQGSLEERIAKLLVDKRALADAVVGGGEAWLSELSDDELAELVALDAEATR